MKSLHKETFPRLTIIQTNLKKTFNNWTLLRWHLQGGLEEVIESFIILFLFARARHFFWQPIIAQSNSHFVLRLKLKSNISSSSSLPSDETQTVRTCLSSLYDCLLAVSKNKKNMVVVYPFRDGRWSYFHGRVISNDSGVILHQRPGASRRLWCWQLSSCPFHLFRWKCDASKGAVASVSTKVMRFPAMVWKLNFHVILHPRLFVNHYCYKLLQTPQQDFLSISKLFPTWR